MFSALVCGLFLFNSIAYPFTPSQTSKTSQTSALTIPTTLGSVTDTYTGDARKPRVILISDAHCNAEVQRNIAGIVACAKKTFGTKLTTVGVEGTAGEIDTSIVRNIPNDVLRNALTQRMVERGYVTGPELYDIMHPNSITLYGVEDTTLYAKNFQELKKGLVQEHAWRQATTILHAVLDHDWKQNKNQALQKLHTLETTRDTQHIQSYLAVLKTIPRAPPIQRTTYPNLFFHIESNRIFREVTMARLSSETKGLYKRVRKYFSAREQKTLEAQKEQDYHVFVATLLELMKERRIAVPRAYSTVLQYQQGLEYQARVNSIVLLDEWEKYRYAAQCNCATTLDEKQLVYLTHVMNLFEAYCGNNATSAARATFEVNQPTFFRLLAQRYPYTNLNPIKTCTSSMQTFYSTAIKRNEAMVKNLLSQKGSVYVLVAGGFHEEGLKACLRSRGCSYTAVLPAISDDKGKSKALYRARLFSQDNRVSANTSLALVSVFVNQGACACTMLDASRKDVIRLYHDHSIPTDALRTFLGYFRGMSNSALDASLQTFSRELFESCFVSSDATLAAMERGCAFEVLVPNWADIRATLPCRVSSYGTPGRWDPINIFDHIQQTVRNVDSVVDEMACDKVFFPHGVGTDAKDAMKRHLRMVMFFHDLGADKIVDGKVDGRIHELNSEKIVRPCLWSLGYREKEIAEVCFLVKYHGTMGYLGAWDERFDSASDKHGVEPWIEAFAEPREIAMLTMVSLCDVSNRNFIGDEWNTAKMKTTAHLMQQWRFGPAEVQAQAKRTWDVFFGNYRKMFGCVRSLRTDFPFLTDLDFAHMRVETFNAMYGRFGNVLTTHDLILDDVQWVRKQGDEYAERTYHVLPLAEQFPGDADAFVVAVKGAYPEFRDAKFSKDERRKHVDKVVWGYCMFVQGKFESLYNDIAQSTRQSIPQGAYEDALRRLKTEYDALSPEEKYALQEATIFHDIGYASAGKEQYHAARGAAYVSEFFRTTRSTSYVATVQWIVARHGDFSEFYSTMLPTDIARMTPSQRICVHCFAAFDGFGKPAPGGNKITLTSLTEFEKFHEITTGLEYYTQRMPRLFCPVSWRPQWRTKEDSATFQTHVESMVSDVPEFRRVMGASFRTIAPTVFKDFFDVAASKSPVFTYDQAMDTAARLMAIVGKISIALSREGIDDITFDTDDVDFMGLPVPQRPPYLQAMVRALAGVSDDTIRAIDIGELQEEIRRSGASFAVCGLPFAGVNREGSRCILQFGLEQLKKSQQRSTALHKGTFREILANAWEAVKNTVSATGRAVSESFGLLQSFAQRRGTPERQVTPQDMAAVLDSVAAEKRVDIGRQEQKTADDLLAEMQKQGVRVDTVRVFDLPLATADSWLKVFVYEGVVYISKDLVEMIVRGVVRTEEVEKHEEIEVKVEQALQTRKRVPKKAVWDVLSRHGMTDRDRETYRREYALLTSKYKLTDEEERMECAHQLTLLIPAQRTFYDTVDQCVDVKPMMNEDEYDRFMRFGYSQLLGEERMRAVDAVPGDHVRLLDANDHWYNLTLDADFHGDATLFNLWTLRRARRLFSRMKLWQHWQSMEKDELDVTEFPPDRAYRLAKGDDTRDIVGIGDVHGDLNMMVLPLVREGICTVTGDLVWYDVKNHRRADPGEITRDTVQNYILIPDLAFVPGVDRRLVVQFLGDIVDRGEWTDECYFLLEDLFARAPERLMSGVFGNHDLSVGRPEFDLLSGNIFGRQKYIREGFDHLLESGRYTVARAVRGIWVSHSFPDKNFIEVLLENMDEHSLGSTNAVREHEASLNLRGFVGDTTGRYARVPGILERMRDSRKDPTISISHPDLELVIEFLNAIFRKGILSDDPDDVQVVRSLFWINNLGRNPHCLTRDRFCNILWAMVHQMGGMLNVSQVFGHDARVSPSPKGRLKVRADLDGSYATQDDGCPRPCYFKIDGTNGKVQRIEFANPRRVFVGDVAEVPALSFDSLFDSAASVERAIADGTFGVLMPPRAIRKDEFDALQFVRNKGALWQELIQQGYIDENGVLKPAFKTIVATHLQDTDHPSKQLQLAGQADGSKQEIYNILARGLGWEAWWERLATQTGVLFGAQKTTQGHILQTIRNVDEVVDSMVEQGLVSARGVEQYKRRARLLMLFHDIGKAFDDDNRDDRYGPQRQHGSLSGVIFRELFTRLRYKQDAIDRDCYVIENHAAPGMLGAGLLWFNEDNHHEITERGLDVVDFVQGFADEQEVGMLNVVALCDMLHRTPFLHGTGNLTKINEVCARMRDVVNDRGNEAAQDRLVDYLWYRGQIRAAVDREANSLGAALHHWIPRVSITNMIAMVMYFRKRAFPLTDTDMETIHRLRSAA